MKISKTNTSTNIGGQLWLYVTIILVYFILIGIVITVLLLAPRYPTLYKEKVVQIVHPSIIKHAHAEPHPIANIVPPPPPPPLPHFDQSDSESIVPDEAPRRPDSYPDSYVEKFLVGQIDSDPPAGPFKSSERDPIQDIDPRSNQIKIQTNNGETVSEGSNEVNKSIILRSMQR